MLCIPCLKCKYFNLAYLAPSNPIAVDPVCQVLQISSDTGENENCASSARSYKAGLVVMFCQAEVSVSEQYMTAQVAHH